jgi:hypothetical protein
MAPTVIPTGRIRTRTATPAHPGRIGLVGAGDRGSAATASPRKVCAQYPEKPRPTEPILARRCGARQRRSGRGRMAEQTPGLRRRIRAGDGNRTRTVSLGMSATDWHGQSVGRSAHIWTALLVTVSVRVRLTHRARSGHGGPRHVPSIAARVSVVPRQYMNADSSRREHRSIRSNVLLKRAGLPKIRLHDSRHTTLSLMEKAGVPISIVSRWAGHYDAAFTMRPVPRERRRPEARPPECPHPSRVPRLLRTNWQPRSVPMKEGPSE